MSTAADVPKLDVYDQVVDLDPDEAPVYDLQDIENEVATAEVLGLIDTYLTSISHQHIVPANDVHDFCLDLRLAVRRNRSWS